MKPEDWPESSSLEEIARTTATTEPEKSKRSYIREQILQNATTTVMMSWEIKSRQKRKDQACRKTVEAFPIVMMN